MNCKKTLSKDFVLPNPRILIFSASNLYNDVISVVRLLSILSDSDSNTTAQ